jgi:hypothetical protein
MYWFVSGGRGGGFDRSLCFCRRGEFVRVLDRGSAICFYRRREFEETGAGGWFRGGLLLADRFG